ncbi:MAG: hypothetical protein WC718_17485 [Phycisphaerales bacterium]|jgi:hypothetical protein
MILADGPFKYAGGIGLVFQIVGAEVSPTTRNWSKWVGADNGINAPYDTRYNTVVTEGFNLSANGGPEDATDGNFGFSFEEHYVAPPGSNGPVFEWHVYSHDLSGVSHRALSMMLPKSGVGGTLSFQLDVMNFGDYANTFQCFALDLKNKHGWLKGGMDLIANENNTQWLRQRAADGLATLALPYIDGADVLNMGGAKGLHVTGNAAEGGSYPNRFVTFNCMGIADGGSVIASYSPAITGSLNALLLQGQASGELRVQLSNSGTAMLDLVTSSNAASGSADAVVQYRVGSGAAGWSVGLDNSDADAFVWSTGSLGSGNKLRLDRDGNLRVTGSLGVGNSQAATTLGTVTKKVELFDAAGASLGYVPIFDAIT